MRLTNVMMLVAAVFAVCFFCGCNKKKKGKAVKEREVRVTLQKLEKHTFRRVIPVQGTVSPLRYAVVSAKVSGVLEKLRISEGDFLKAGTVLFEIDRQVLKNQVMVKENEVSVKRASLESARIGLERARINLEKAQLDYDRFERLWKSRATSQSEYESAVVNFKNAQADVKKAQADIVNAQAQLKQAEGNLVIARKNLADSSTRAPFDCTVTKTYFEENEYVSVGNNLVKIEDLTEFEIISYISSVYYPIIVQGKTAVNIRLDGKNMGRAVVTLKAPAIDPVSRTFKIKVKVPKNIKLASGALCDIDIILEEKESYGLPSDAILLRAGNRHICYAMGKDKRAVSFDVIPGIVDGRRTEIVNNEKLRNELFVVTGQTFVNAGTLLSEVKKK